ncbi:MAG: Acyl-CoA thioester hydrolase YbgC [Syntrophorhabdus sp. PtaU1.Bin002]|nr:MAG: Acyl-CoA thioester hydrolase YbgC [Syntrophorhabdus sp. PtaB.Bin006]OPY72028.1 MAG: Acyl-CoA thioester hydrolase YbgC [Syntrophorhabdus sp. PtaU1.Bin002]OPY73065.1 MAG: Acyl-CoA thioester hydrolase YbgC [Syntrophorhabdus sp. PtaU1.Bin050]
MDQSRDSGRNEALDYVDTPIRVRYADTDTMHVVYYGTYPVYFEVGRAEYMRTKGFTYREFESTGYHLVVVSMEAKYHGSAAYDDLLTVRTRISELKSRGLTFHYEIYRDGSLIVEGKTKHICTNSDKKTVVMPSPLFDLLKDVCSQ